MHTGQFGRDCAWKETLRPLAYGLWNTPLLREALLSSPFCQGAQIDDSGPLRFSVWLTQDSERYPGLSNYLCLLLFIVQLRGMP